MTTPDINDYFCLGRFTKPVGLQGELKAIWDTNDPKRYYKQKEIWVLQNTNLVYYNVKSIRSTKQNEITLQLGGINTIEAAEKLAKKEIFLPVSLLPPLSENLFYYHEIIGFQVLDNKLGNIGTVVSFYEMSVHDILSIEKEKTEILLPVVNDFIIRVDRENKILEVNVPDGLLDIYLEPLSSTE